jgi:hypothetical protein
MSENIKYGLGRIGEGIAIAGMCIGLGIVLGMVWGGDDISFGGGGVTGSDMRLAMQVCDPKSFDERIACLTAIYGGQGND